MRVVATKDFRTYYRMVLVQAKKDQEFEGGLADHLYLTRCPVEVVEDEPPATEPFAGDGDGDPDDDGGTPSPAGDDDGDQPPENATIEQVIAWVDGDPERALAALEAERQAAKPRSTLVRQLEELTAPTGPQQ